MSILMTEYDYATDIAVQKEEAYEDGLFAGREEGISIGLATGREEGISIGLERGLEQGISQGAYQNKLETARSMLSRMLPADLVVDCTNLPLETVQQLEREVNPFHTHNNPTLLKKYPQAAPKDIQPFKTHLGKLVHTYRYVTSDNFLTELHQCHILL